MKLTDFPKNKLTNSTLKLWAENNWNVMLVGRHGCGKTARIKDVLTDLNINWIYFSGSTLDPWTDVVGIPITKEKGDKQVIDYVLPEGMDENLEAIFIDEYNRTHPKVRNALMELIQFKSINGRKFPRLRFIWVAVNPPKDESDDDEFEYDVEDVDQAQMDRFHIITRVDETPDIDYFTIKYGTYLAKQALSWWKSQSKEAQKSVSARRLDYALEIFQLGGNVVHVLPQFANIVQFNNMLTSDPCFESFKVAVSKKDWVTVSTLLQEPSSWDIIYSSVFKGSANFKAYAEFFCLSPKESIIRLMSENKKFLELVSLKALTSEVHLGYINDVANADIGAISPICKNVLSIRSSIQDEVFNQNAEILSPTKEVEDFGDAYLINGIGQININSGPVMRKRLTAMLKDHLALKMSRASLEFCLKKLCESFQYYQSGAFSLDELRVFNFLVKELDEKSFDVIIQKYCIGPKSLDPFKLYLQSLLLEGKNLSIINFDKLKTAEEKVKQLFTS